MKKICFNLFLFAFFFYFNTSNSNSNSISAYAADLISIAEKSHWVKTGRAEEAQRLCRNFHKAFPKQVQCVSFGTTPEGRNLFYLVVGNHNDPTIWVQAGIHAGEIDGKDAVFWLLREALQKKINPNPLKGICVVFIPIVNLDGHERFGKWNRPNQVGPEEMGWRVTSQNYNMNRDFMKADTPEMRALLKLWHKVDPVLSLDLHVTDGAQFQPEVGLVIHPNQSIGNTPFHQLGSEFEKILVEKMKARGHSALPFYPSFEKDDDPTSGFSREVSTARFSNGYWFNNNRLAMLVETHSWKDYATRVKTHYSTVLLSMEQVQAHGIEWKKAMKEVDAQSLAGKNVDLEFKHTEKFSTIDFPGYEYEIKKSKISGGEVIHYFPDKPKIWKVHFYEELVPKLTVVAPQEGYFFESKDASGILPILDVHHIKYQKIKLAPTSLQVFRSTQNDFSAASYEGHQTLSVKGEWKNEDIKLLNPSYFVPIAQPGGRIVLQLFEPLAQDSFLAWGYFNRYFERKEYMENYVAEDVGNEMLKDPKIKAEFDEKLKDPNFAKDPKKRFLFFYQKHPSWDERYSKYPVYKK